MTHQRSRILDIVDSVNEMLDCDHEWHVSDVKPFKGHLGVTRTCRHCQVRETSYINLKEVLGEP
jgi:hypothetical protein